jgi:hypothetical protein
VGVFLTVNYIQQMEVTDHKTSFFQAFTLCSYLRIFTRIDKPTRQRPMTRLGIIPALNE